MVSPTKQSRSIRKKKHRKMGRDRKNAMHSHGTTLPQSELFKVVSASEPK